jgi:hypothetical protein
VTSPLIEKLSQLLHVNLNDSNIKNYILEGKEMTLTKSHPKLLLTLILLEILTISVASSSFLTKSVTADSGESWLTGWQYRKSHVVNSAAGAGENYQVQVDVAYSSDKTILLWSQRTGNPIADVPRSWAGDPYYVVDAPAFFRKDANTIYLCMEGYEGHDPGEEIGILKSTDDGQTWVWQADPLAGWAGGQSWNSRGDEACPAPVQVGNTIYMFYSSRPPSPASGWDWNTGVATSTDWVTFTNDNTHSPILPLGGSGAWDEYAVFHTTKPILKDGTWYIYYTGRDSVGNGGIGYATTSEASFPGGWTKQTVIAPIWSTGTAQGRPKIIQVSGTYYMFYCGNDGNTKVRTSTVLGSTWSSEEATSGLTRECDVFETSTHGFIAAVAPGTGYWTSGQCEIGIWKTPENVVSLQGHSKTDFGDVRFTDDDGSTLLDYWMEEKIDGDHAVFWVEVADDLSTVAQTIYIYYGKGDVITTSNGANTFPLLFDHFDNGIVDNPPWTGIQDASESGTLVKIGDASRDYDNIMTAVGVMKPNRAVRASMKIYDTSWGYIGILAPDIFLGSSWQSTTQYQYSAGSTVNYIDGDPSDDVYRTCEIAWIPGTVNFGVDSATASSAFAPIDDRYISFRAYDENKYVYVDWALVRNYVSPEPTHGSWGNEEAFTALTVSCNPTTVLKTGTQTTTISGELTSGGLGVNGKIIKLYYQGGATGADEPPTDGPWTSITTEGVSTGSEGSYSYDWNPDDTLPNGYYWIKAEFEGDASYYASSKTTGVDMVSNLFVIPEYSLGTILALAVCFVGVIVYRKSKYDRKKTP